MYRSQGCAGFTVFLTCSVIVAEEVKEILHLAMLHSAGSSWASLRAGSRCSTSRVREIERRNASLGASSPDSFLPDRFALRFPRVGRACDLKSGLFVHYLHCFATIVRAHKERLSISGICPKKRRKFLKKLWCCVGGKYNEVIWFYQLV